MDKLLLIDTNSNAFGIDRRRKRAVIHNAHKKQSIFRIICSCQPNCFRTFFLHWEWKNLLFLDLNCVSPPKKKTKIRFEWIIFLLYALRSLAALLTASLLLHCFLGLYNATGFLYFPHIQLFFSQFRRVSLSLHFLSRLFSASLSRFDHCATVQIAPLSLSFEYNQPIFENAKGVVFHQDIETHRELFYKCKVDSLMEWWWLLVRVWRMRIFQVTCLCVCHTEKTIAVDNARKTAFVVWVQHR